MKVQINGNEYSVKKVSKTYSKTDGFYKVNFVLENPTITVEEITQVFIDNENVTVTVIRDDADNIVYSGLTLDYAAEDVFDSFLELTLIANVAETIDTDANEG